MTTPNADTPSSPEYIKSSLLYIIEITAALTFPKNSDMPFQHAWKNIRGTKIVFLGLIRWSRLSFGLAK